MSLQGKLSKRLKTTFNLMKASACKVCFTKKKMKKKNAIKTPNLWVYEIWLQDCVWRRVGPRSVRCTCHNVVCLFRYKNIPPLASTVWQLQIPFQIQWQVFVTSSRWELKCKISLNIFLYWIKFFRLLKTKQISLLQEETSEREREGRHEWTVRNINILNYLHFIYFIRYGQNNCLLSGASQYS